MRPYTSGTSTFSPKKIIMKMGSENIKFTWPFTWPEYFFSKCAANWE
jgi:hypothetical protein